MLAYQWKDYSNLEIPSEQREPSFAIFNLSPFPKGYHCNIHYT